ncbi:MAG: FeoA family protein [Candidatus Odinarchaeia archaeon]
MRDKNQKLQPLTSLNPGEKGVVIKINGDSGTRRRLLDMGVVKGAIINVVRRAPLGDPIEFIVKNYHLTLRKKEGEQILVRQGEY